MEGSPVLAAGASGAAASTSPTSPVDSRHGLGGANGGGAGGPKRKRSMHGLEHSSPGSPGDDHDGDEKKRQPGVKRACNECRQQKLRCDVVQDPFTSCTRCNRLKLECKIESNFKRVGKRSKHAEMEKEIERLHRSLRMAREQGFVVEDDEVLQSPTAPSHYTHTHTHTHTRNPSLMGSDEAVSSLLTLKRGGSFAMAQPFAYELGPVQLTEDVANVLFGIFFSCYHPFLPFLQELQPPDAYHQQHRLLFWTIVAIGARRYQNGGLLAELSAPLTKLLWDTIGEVPTNYYIVKALCLLCTWPLPTSHSTADPTHILCGVMMKTATGIGLHRPNHIQDFSRVQVDLNSEQLHDRVTTWAVCNIVAQSIGTGYGQPASTLYDWTLAFRPGDGGPIGPNLLARLQIERFCDKVSKEMYSNASDPRGVAGDEHRSMLMRVYRREYGELQASILSQDHGSIVSLHVKAAALHLRLAGFFDSSSTPDYMDDLMGLWKATTGFLDEVLLDENSDVLRYATNYIQQMIVAAGFSLMKLLGSFFARTVNTERGRILFHRTINAIRATSVNNNDLQHRLAELMVQMWNGAKMDRAMGDLEDDDYDSSNVPVDDSLQLKVRCRHSMSLVFDSIWRWRDEYLSQGRGSLDQLNKNTNPDSANESSASSTHMDATLLPQQPMTSNALLASNGALTPTPTGMSAASGPSSMLGGLGYGDPANLDYFDPQHWMLDNLLGDITSVAGLYAQPLEGV